MPFLMMMYEAYHLIRIFEFGRSRYVFGRTDEEGLQREGRVARACQAFAKQTLGGKAARARA